MDENTTYTKTGRGLRALIKKLPRDAGHILSVMDKSLTMEEILARLDNMNVNKFEEAINWLLEGGFIKTVVTDPFSNTMWEGSSVDAMQVDEIDIAEFTISEKPPANNTKQKVIPKKTPQEIESEANEKAKFEAQKKRLEQADAEARERAEATLKAKTDAENQAIQNKSREKAETIAKAEQATRERAEAEAKAKAELEANVKKEEEARRKAEEKAAAEEKAKLEAEEKAKLEALAKAEKEARERAEAEAKAKAELEAKAKKEEEARRKAEEKAAAEEKAKLEAEEKAKLEALAKAEKEARERAEAEAKAKAELEAKAKKEEDEKRARLDAIAKAEQDAKAEAEKKAKLEAEEKARLEAIAKKEEAARKKAEAKAIAQAEKEARKEEKAKQKAEAKAVAEKKAIEKAAAKEQAKLELVAKNEEKALKKIESKEAALIKKQKIINSVRSILPGKRWLVSAIKGIKPLSIFALAVLFLLIIAAQFINMSILRAPVEKIATENIQAKVNIKSINVSLFPKPHLLLKDITVADSKTINIKKMRVYPSLNSIKNKLLNQSNAPYEIRTVDIEGFNIAQKDLPQINSWAGASSRHQQLKIQKISLESMSINLNVMQLPYFDGELMLDSAGLLQSANFAAEKNNLHITINRINNEYAIDVKALRWRSPLSPHPIFTKLDAKGIIKDNVLDFTSITGALYNGDISGKIEMDLASPSLSTKGTFNLTNFYIGDMARELKIDTVVDGKLNINGSLIFDINKPLNLIELAGLDAVFTIQNGSLRKVDLAEAMRSGNLNGSTDFTSFNGKISLNDKRYSFNNLSLKDNQLLATGQFTVSSDQYVSGTISTSIALKRNAIRSRLNIAGPVTALKLKN